MPLKFVSILQIKVMNSSYLDADVLFLVVLGGDMIYIYTYIFARWGCALKAHAGPACG